MKDRNKWTNRFRRIRKGKLKGSHHEFIKLYKKMKKEKEMMKIKNEN